MEYGLLRLRWKNVLLCQTIQEKLWRINETDIVIVLRYLGEVPVYFTLFLEYYSLIFDTSMMLMPTFYSLVN